MFLVLPIPDLVRADTLEGLFGVEVENPGEAYSREQTLTSDALDLPGATPLLLTTRFADDTWLPRQRLEILWRHPFPLPSGGSWTVGFRTTCNRRRRGQDLELLGNLRGEGENRWRLCLPASLREARRSLVGHAPIRANLFLDAMATASWELHRREGERIQPALATIGLSRNFRSPSPLP